MKNHITFFPKRKESFLFILFSLFLSCSFLVNLNLYAVKPPNIEDSFIFSVEIPAYTPFKDTLSPEDLFALEQKYAIKKGVSQTSFKSSFTEEAEYYIESPLQEGSKPWRGLFTPYYTKLTSTSDDVILSLEENAQDTSAVACLFRDQAFGESEKESRTESELSMRIIILANRMKSIFAIRNQSLKHESKTLHHKNNVLLLRGTWEPKWMKKIGKKSFPVRVKEVRKYMRHCLFMSEVATTEEDKHRWLEEARRLLNKEREVSGHVPYHELREYLRNAPERNVFVQELVNLHPDATLYEATHDKDLVELRITPDRLSLQRPLMETRALYSHYQDMLLRSKREKQQYPDILTTGYRAAYEPERFDDHNHFAWVYQAIEEDRYARADSSQVDFRVAYIAEPNCLYRVPAGKVSITESYIHFPNGESLSKDTWNNYDPCESMAIMTQMFRNRGAQVRIDFDPTHPVIMCVPERMLRDKKSKTDFKLEKCGRYDISTEIFSIYDLKRTLEFSSRISQTPFSYRDYAVTLYRQLGLCGGKREKYDLFRSLIPTIFNFYDIRSFIRVENVLLAPTQLQITYTKGKREDDPGIGVFIRRLNWMISLKTADQQIKELKGFIDEEYGDKCLGMADILFKTAEAIGNARKLHYQAFFLSDPAIKALRTPPKHTSSPNKKSQQHTVKQEDKDSIAADLFGSTSCKYKDQGEETCDHTLKIRDTSSTSSSISIVDASISSSQEAVIQVTVASNGSENIKIQTNHTLIEVKSYNLERVRKIIRLANSFNVSWGNLGKYFGNISSSKNSPIDKLINNDTYKPRSDVERKLQTAYVTGILQLLEELSSHNHHHYYNQVIEAAKE